MPALYHTNKAAFTNRLNTYTQTDMDTHKNKDKRTDTLYNCTTCTISWT